MRLIDQTGTLDIPYEKTILTVEENVIRASVLGVPEHIVYIMGVYSSPEAAQLEVSKLHNMYEVVTSLMVRVFRFGPDVNAEE